MLFRLVGYRKMEGKRLGDILLEAGLIDGELLRSALAIQAGNDRRLGEVLLSLGLPEQLLMKVLEFQLGLPRVSLAGRAPDAELCSLLPRQLAEKHLVFPLEIREDGILVAMADPLDYPAIEEIRRITGRQVQVCLAARSEVAEAVARCYASLGPG